jgi:hypothetical protein
MRIMARRVVDGSPGLQVPKARFLNEVWLGGSDLNPDTVAESGSRVSVAFHP